MSAASVKNIEASVKNRFLAAAPAKRKAVPDVTHPLRSGRFLFRLSLSPLKEKFVLKGGLLLVGMGATVYKGVL